MNSLWSKTLSVFTKNASSSDTQNNVRILVATAHDIDGQGFSGETVCFTASAKNGQTSAPIWFAGTVQRPTGGPLSLSQTQQVPVPNGASPSATCVRTDANGNAAVEIENSNQDTVDVASQFFNEGLFRFQKLDFSLPQQTIDNTQPPTNPALTPGGSANTGNTAALAAVNPGTTSPTSQQLKASGVTVKTKVLKAKDRVMLARVARGRKAADKRHYLMVGVLSYSHKTVRIRVLLLDKSRKAVRTKTFTIRTNRLVVRRLPWNSRVRSVRVRLVG